MRTVIGGRPGRGRRGARRRRRGLFDWLRQCARHCLIGLTVSSGTVAPQLAEPWPADPWPADAAPPLLPPGHPERIPDLPLSAVESELWSQLTR